jgi:ubiquinone biosynthesis accessory factor UbiK
MIKPEDIKKVAKKIIDSIPSGAKQLPEDLQKHFQQAMHDAFSKMDLVTQEEFEVQSKVLHKTREKLTALEARVKELEALLEDKGPSE